MSIFSGLKTYKDRMDEEKGPMRLWVINTWEKIDKSDKADIPDPLKNWCKCSITTASEVYEFLLDDYRDSFKGVKNTEGGLKEIIGYLLFCSIVVGGDPFFEKLKFTSINELLLKVGNIFDFEKSTYQRFDKYIMDYKKNKERILDLEAEYLLFSIITETNPPMREFPQDMQGKFMAKLVMQNIVFNKLLEEKKLL